MSLYGPYTPVTVSHETATRVTFQTLLVKVARLEQENASLREALGQNVALRSTVGYYKGWVV
jgi:hypothetical protein